MGLSSQRKPDFTNDFVFKITTGPVTMLGITFTNNGDDLFRLNFIPKLSRLKSLLRLWSSRDLTPVGRSIIVKTLALSQLVYLFLVLPNPPHSFITDLERTIAEFIWSGKPNKIKRTTLFNTMEDGGLKVTVGDLTS